MPACQHFDEIKVFESDVRECGDCIAAGSRWVHLRLCLGCGYVGCCDSSPNRHVSKHVAAEGHPAVRSLEPGETWGYCYEDDAWVDFA
jgi:Zn ribbon nucleic-acid-binding protein